MILLRDIENHIGQVLDAKTVLAELNFLQHVDSKRRYYDDDIIKKALYRYRMNLLYIFHNAYSIRTKAQCVQFGIMLGFGVFTVEK